MYISKDVFNVLDNDTDADGDALTLTTAVSNFGEVIVNADQSLTYTPEQNFVGQDQIGASRRQVAGYGDATLLQLMAEGASHGCPHLDRDSCAQQQHQPQHDTHDLGADAYRTDRFPEPR